jgi:hypothetical protein
MATLVNYLYHALAVYIIVILVKLFIKEKQRWDKALLYLLSAVPLVIRVLRLK